jgi:replicative superfamily II helicase
LVQHLVDQGEKVIVFRNQRGKTERCAKDLARALGLPPATETLRQLPSRDGSTASAELRACLEGGIAFHNANLNREERAVVEQSFRDPASPVRVLVATTTVAAGVNTPASTVILVEQDFPSEGGRPFTVAEYKNMAGRAGRLGFDRGGRGEEGRAILYAYTSEQSRQLFERYVKGQAEPIRSSFTLEEIETWTLRLLAQAAQVPKEELSRLLVSTYGGYLSNLQNPDWKLRMQERLDPLVDQMIEQGWVEMEGKQIHLTLLGQALGRSSLSYRSALRLVEMLRSVAAETLTAERLMALIQSLPEADRGYTPMLKGSRQDATLPQETARRYGSDIVALLQRNCHGELDYLARCKRACLLGDWIEGAPVEEIEKRYTTNPFRGVIGHGDIRKYADATRRHLRAAYEIVGLVAINHGVSPESMEALLKRLEVGIPSEAVGLLNTSSSINRGACIALYQSGRQTPEAPKTLEVEP